MIGASTIATAGSADTPGYTTFKQSAERGSACLPVDFVLLVACYSYGPLWLTYITYVYLYIYHLKNPIISSENAAFVGTSIRSIVEITGFCLKLAATGCTPLLLVLYHHGTCV